jgi:pimeloyl-ACP methyl ester carboxylesterase
MLFPTAAPGNASWLLGRPGRTIKTALFLAQAFPGSPIRLPRWVPPRPHRESITFSAGGSAWNGHIYGARRRGRQAGVVVFLGTNRAGLDDPRAVRMAEGLARAGFIALMCSSTALVEGELELRDIDMLVAAHRYLASRADVDPRRNGFLGVCIGAAFALLAAARLEIAERVAFLVLLVPYYSARDLIRALASGSTYSEQDLRSWPVPWDKYPDTRRHFERLLLSALDDEAEREQVRHLVQAFQPEPAGLSPAASAVYQLLTGCPFEESVELLERLPVRFLENLDRASPRAQLDGLRAETLVIHSAGDRMVPVEEARRLVAALRQHVPTTYSEPTIFDHVDLTRATNLRILVRELLEIATATQVLLRHGGCTISATGVERA